MCETLGKLPSRGDLVKSVGSEFTMALDGSPFAAKLISVDEHVSNELQENFSLMFLAEAGSPPVQGIFNLDHPELGKMELFLVPVKQDSGGLYYQAVFNLLLDAAN